ncbi:TPA: hypothetical protein ACNUX9_003868 [Providencia rettgeri]
MISENSIKLFMSFLFGMVVTSLLIVFLRNTNDERQVKAFTQLCNEFEVQVTNKDYRLSCDKGYIDIDAKGYLMANDIIKNKSKNNVISYISNLFI